MKFSPIVNLLSLGLLIHTAGCGESGSSEEPTGLRMLTALDAHSDTREIRYTITPCDGGDAVVTQSSEIDQSIQLPGGIPEFENKPFDENSEHAFADLFSVLPAGCYNVLAEPLSERGEASEACAPASLSGVVVAEGSTVEKLIVVQCKMAQKGALDVVVTLNHQPTVEDISFTKSKFVCGASSRICLAGADVDNDPLSYDLVGGHDQPLDDGCSITPVADEAGCFDVTCNHTGRINLAARVYDNLWVPVEGGAPGEIAKQTIESLYVEAGRSDTSHGQLEFFTYFAGNSYYPDTDGDSHGDESGTPTLVCAGALPPDGYVPSNDDCDDSLDTVNPDQTEACNAIDDNCDGTIDEGCECIVDTDCPDGTCVAGACEPNCVGECCEDADCTDGLSCVANACVTTGLLSITMTWDSIADADLHVLTPTGEHLYFSNPTVTSGYLERDACISNCQPGELAVENAYFVAGLACGTYQVYALNYNGGTASAFDVHFSVTNAGVLSTVDQSLPATAGSQTTPFTVQIPC